MADVTAVGYGPMDLLQYWTGVQYCNTDFDGDPADIACDPVDYFDQWQRAPEDPELNLDLDEYYAVQARECEGCGGHFLKHWTNRERRYCRPSCRKQKTHNRVRDVERAKHDLEFIGIDGEGVKRFDADGNIIGHDYVLMVAGGNGHKPIVLRHDDGAKLTTSEIFDWLYFKVFAAFPRACFVTYSMGYDMSQWVQGSPKIQAEKLYTKKGIAKRQRKKSGGNPTPFPVYWRDPVKWEGEYEIDVLGSKRFKLRWKVKPWRDFDAQSEVDETSKKNEPPILYMYINDVFSYWQGAFLKAIDPDPNKTKHSVCSQEEFDKIKEGKARREHAELDEEMIKYCALEVEVLSRLAQQLNRGMVEHGIKLPKTKFFGPGQIAQAILDQSAVMIDEYDYIKDKWIKVNTLSRKHHEAVVPFEFRDGARQTYYGGWFEVFYQGTNEGVAYEDDINSAYPDDMKDLPCLLHGRYLSGKGDPYRAKELRGRQFGATRGTVQCMVEATVKGSNPRIGAMLHRIAKGPHKGSVIRPHLTEGWFWLHEIEAAKRAKLIDQVDFMQWRAYEPCDCEPPLRELETMYLERLKIGKNTPGGISRKLGYNSVYGKLAQSIGQPKYANPVYASLITAGCRSRILDAIATHPRGTAAVLMIATDGIYWDDQHPTLHRDKDELGAWDESQRVNLTLFKPGCYWDDDVRKALGDEAALANVKLKARGVNMKALANEITRIDELFATMQPGDPWPSVTITTPFSVVSPTQALARKKWSTCGAVSYVNKIEVSSDPTIKRRASGPGWSRPWPVSLAGIRSEPYRARFGEELPEGEMIEDHPLKAFTHPDGDMITQTDGLLHGSFMRI